MNRGMALALAFAMALCVCLPEAALFAAPVTEVPSGFEMIEKTDRSKLPRTIITTDLEVDDTNGILLTLMYADQFDIAGIVWSAGMFHWNGDGGRHTLAEITPNFRCPPLDAGTYTEYRPVQPGLLERLITENYAEDYKLLSKNNPNYPTPDELLAVTKTGNIEFEGDVRFDTEGSDWIKQCILDDDPRPLIIQSWGGGNTYVRALLSIYEEYGDTDQWEAIRQKVVGKVYLRGSGEDNCRADQKIDEIYPGLHSYAASGGGGYGNYFSANDASMDLRRFYQGDWLADAFKLNHGKVLGEFHLMGDGQLIPGETEWFQYGRDLFIDWSASPENNENRDLSAYPRRDFDVLDWMCTQFGNTSFLTGFGLRGFVDGDFVNPNYGTIGGRITIDGVAQNRAGNYNANDYNPVTGRADSAYGNHFTEILFEELAARADWAIAPFADANHAPIVRGNDLDVYAKAGESVKLFGSVADPDGDAWNTTWQVWNAASEYDGAAKGRLAMWDAQPTAAQFTVPTDAQPGDYFNILMEVQDEAGRPMTRFAQFIVHVYDGAAPAEDVEDLTINTPAEKLSYTLGKSLELTGMTLKATMADGTERIVDVSADMVTGYNGASYYTAVLGEQTLSVAYGGKTVSYQVAVSAPSDARGPAFVSKGAPGPTGDVPATDRSKLPRTIITTDLEVDDTNGILLTLMYADQFDIAGIVWSAGMFHFNGDGKGTTLGEITSHIRCPAPDATSLTEYRPVEHGRVERLITENYANDYKYLSKNNPNYPAPEELLAVTKTGNIEFEGDVRFDTEGSDLIKACILDDDPRPLIIQSWGGGNTYVRALLSIYEEYGETDQWGDIRQKVVDKVYLRGDGEDYCRADQNIDAIYPGLHSYNASGGGSYGNYFSANDASMDIRRLYQGEYLADAFKYGHGEVLGEFHLMGDGQTIPGETDWFNYGFDLWIDWANSPENNPDRDLSGYPRRDFDVYDWMCSQFGNTSFLTGFGPRGFADGQFANPNYGTIGGRIALDGIAQNRAGNYNANEYNPVTGRMNSAYGSYFTNILFEEMAARADWAISEYEDCNHPPVVAADTLDFYAKPGEQVKLYGSVTDPDGDAYGTKWQVWNAASEYDGAAKGRVETWDNQPESAQFTVPTDAQAGDYFNILMEVKDEAGRPMTRFAQFIVHVYDGAAPVEGVTGIAVNTPPEKTVYAVGKSLELTGMTLKADMADGSTRILDVAADMVTGYTGASRYTAVMGEQKLTIAYGGQATEFSVEVTPPKQVLDHVVFVGVNSPEVTEFGDRAEYAFTANGLRFDNLVEITFEVDGSILDVSGAKIEGMNGFTQFEDIKWVDDGGGKLQGTAILGVYSGETREGAMEIGKLAFGAKKLGVAELKLVGASVAGVDGEAESSLRVTDIFPASAATRIWSACDLNDDGKVDYADLSLAFYYYQAKEGDGNWAHASVADTDRDGRVNMTDLVAIYANFIA